MPLTFRELGPIGLRRMLEAQERPEHRQDRRVEYGQRALIMAEGYRELAAWRNRIVFEKSRTHQALDRHLDAGTNVLVQAANEFAFVYRRPPVRRLDLEGELGSTLNQRLTQLNRETRIASKAKQWAAYMFGMNLVWVVPFVWRTDAGLRVDYRMVLPDRADRVHGADPFETEILLWARDRTDETKADKTFTLLEPRFGWVLVDAEAYYWLTPDFDVEFAVPHGIGEIPAVEFRVSNPPPRDYWDLGRGRKLVHATLESTRVGASGAWVRSTQNRKLASLFGDIDQVDRDQAAAPEAAVGGTVADKNAVEFKIHDFETTIRSFAEEQDWHRIGALESLGIPASASDKDPERARRAKAELRVSQIDHVRPPEHELAVRTHQLAAAFGHPLSISPDIVRQHYQAIWGPMSLMDNPLDAQRVWEGRIKLGIMDHAMVVQELMPWMSLEQAQAHVLAVVERKAEVDELLARRNVNREAAVFMNLPQIQGRIGGMVPPPAQPPQEEERQ